MYLRCATSYQPRAWVDWLSKVEYCYNTSFHTTLRTTPFEVVYGHPPPPLLPHRAKTAATEVVDSLLCGHDAFVADVHKRLLQAQQHAKHYYDSHHRELEFAVGDWVGAV